MLSWKGRKTSSLKYTQYESEYKIKFLAFELKCIAFFQGWKPFKEILHISLNAIFSYSLQIILSCFIRVNVCAFYPNLLRASFQIWNLWYIFLQSLIHIKLSPHSISFLYSARGTMFSPKFRKGKVKKLWPGELEEFLPQFLVKKTLQNKIWLWRLDFKYSSWPVLAKEPVHVLFSDILVLLNHSNNATRN